MTRMRPRPVTLSSDFGSYYPAAMRGVVHRRGVDRVVDLTHRLPRHDVRQGAFWLTRLVPYQPRSVHCIVVDPGVGSDRAVTIVRAGGHALVAPDNGIAMPIGRALGGEIEVFRFEHREPASHTFHGRDVFAPLAAAIANVGIDDLQRLPTVVPHPEPVSLALPEATTGPGRIETEVLAVDRFGNLITGADGALLAAIDTDAVTVAGDRVTVASHYGAVPPGTPLVTVGSHGNVELAVNRGSARDRFGLAAGRDLTITWPA